MPDGTTLILSTARRRRRVRRSRHPVKGCNYQHVATKALIAFALLDIASSLTDIRGDG
ncbi:hypothetical protein KCP78_20465 [Salmonella enterica subsp. enterica]|nr:hypothetical protein KCP78_20465 [Salmonella enterica subsp. enterica]